MISDADDRFNTRVHKIVRDFTEAFFFFFLQRFLTHHGPRDRQKRKQKRIYTVYATAK